VSSSSVSLSWADNSSGEDSFRIESRTETTSFAEIRSVASNTTSVIITGLKPETLYFFRIRAHGSGGFSGYTQQLSVRTPSKVCAGSSPCFAGDRFKVAVHWKGATGQSGEGTVAQLNPTAGTFWFFSASNIEGVFKVVDGCGSSGSFWFFAGGLTNLETTITVTDTLTGRVKTYANPQGTAFRAVQDTKAFSCQ
jgi:titin